MSVSVNECACACECKDECVCVRARVTMSMRIMSLALWNCGYIASICSLEFKITSLFGIGHTTTT